MTARTSVCGRRRVDRRQTLGEQREPVGGRSCAKARPQRVLALLRELREHPQEGLALGFGHAHPGCGQRVRVALPRDDPEQLAEGGEVHLACATQHGAEQFVAGAEVVEQHPADVPVAWANGSRPSGSPCVRAYSAHWSNRSSAIAGCFCLPTVRSFHVIGGTSNVDGGSARKRRVMEAALAHARWCGGLMVEGDG